MGLFDKIFGREKEVKYDIGNVENILKEKIHEREKGIEPELKEYHARLVELQNRLKSSLQALESAIPKEKMDEQLLFAAQTGRTTFKKKISRVAEAINKSVEFNYQSFSDYFKNCIDAVDQADDSAVAEFKTIGVVFESEARTVVDNLRQLKNSLDDMEGKMKRHDKRLSPYSKSLQSLSDLGNLGKSISETRKEIQRMKTELAEKVEELERARKSLAGLENSNEWKEYERLIQKTRDFGKREREIIANLNEMLASVERPMKKAKNIMEKNGMGDKKKLFDEYLSNPFETFLKDDDVEVLTSFLDETGKMLLENKIDVNENLKKKSIENISQWLQERSFQQLKERYFSEIKDLGDIEKAMKESELPDQKKELQNKISEVETKIKELEKSVENFSKRENEMNTLVKKNKEEVENEIRSLLNSRIEIMMEN